MPGCKVGDLAVIIGPTNPLERAAHNVGKFVRITKDVSSIVANMDPPIMGLAGNKCFTIQTKGNNLLGYIVTSKQWVLRDRIEICPDNWLHPIRPPKKEYENPTQKEIDAIFNFYESKFHAPRYPFKD